MFRLLTLTFCLSVLANAQSILVCEAVGGKILYQSQAYKSRPVASLTKIATAVVALDWARLSQSSLNSRMTVPSSVVGLGGGNPMSLKPGETLTLKDALHSALLGSDNASAQTIAEHVGGMMAVKRGETTSGKVEFIREMNALAKGLGMRATYFANAHGMDNAQERGTSTAVDMVKLSQYALTLPQLKKMISLKSVKVRKFTAEGARSFFPKNTNVLIGTDGFKGIKTGMTGLAGSCLASYCERGSARFICITLGAEDRFGLTQAVVNKAEVTHKNWVQAGRPILDVSKECVRYSVMTMSR